MLSAAARARKSPCGAARQGGFGSLSIGVDGGHQAFDYAEFFCRTAAIGARQLVVQGSSGDNRFRCQSTVLVYAIYDGFHIIAARCGNHDFARRLRRASALVLLVKKETFEDDAPHPTRPTILRFGLAKTLISLPFTTMASSFNSAVL